MARPEDQPNDQGQNQPGENLPTVRDALDIATASRGTLVSPSYYLTSFGFSERFPVLLADLNRKLARIDPHPTMVGITLRPNLDTPQVIWEPKFVPAPEVNVEFPPHRNGEGRLVIGKPIISPPTFYESAGDVRYSDYDLTTNTSLRVDREGTTVGRHERSDIVVAVDWRQLKKFVRSVFPKKHVVLVSRFDEPISDKELRRLGEVGRVFTGSPRTRTIVENLGSLDEGSFQGLPDVGYSVTTADEDYIEALESRKRFVSKELKRYRDAKDVPDDLLHNWWRQTSHSQPLPNPSGNFLFLTIKESAGRRYFEIRGLQYNGRARSIERVLGLFVGLFDVDPSGHSQFQEDRIRRRK